jgi:type VI secretion system protein VasD
MLTACSVFPSKSNKYAKINTQAVSYLNPDVNGRPSPLVVTIYQLKNAYKFKQADYESLAINSAKVLGGDLIDQSSIEIRPGTKNTVQLTLSPHTDYLGIMAAYRNINNGVWHKAIKLSDGVGSHTKVQIDLESQGFAARASENKGLWKYL